MTTATETIWTQLSADLRKFIRRRVADEHVAEDLLQETFLRIHKNIGTLRGEDRLAAWVYQIARNVIHDHHRLRRAVPLTETDPVAESDERGRLIASAEKWLDELIGHAHVGDRRNAATRSGRTPWPVALRCQVSGPTWTGLAEGSPRPMLRLPL